MTSCKDCIHDSDCGIVMEEHAEKCEVYANKLAEEAKRKAAEATTLKIKAAGYDVIKNIVEEKLKEDFSTESCFDMLGGVIFMEEAVMKALI